jgi:hypothetical protein
MTGGEEREFKYVAARKPEKVVISADSGYSNGRALLAKWRSWPETTNPASAFS